MRHHSVLTLVLAAAATIASAAAPPSPAPATAAPATPPPAASAIRAVFVGVDQYRYSSARVPGAGFNDLHGAVGDVGRIKAALHTAYGLDLDAPSAGKCRSGNAVSLTLTDDCADRASILAALDQQIKAGTAGSTLIFYFAGHGSQFIDDQNFDQASGYNDTILPTDARKPGAPSASDILDRELYAIINRATAANINVVTIFDSCNSGTATRDFAGGESRGAPPLHVKKGERPPVPFAGAASGPGYRVHFAAAADGEEAQEVGSVGVRAGVFTAALASTLVELPNASFADIAAEARLRVEELGHPLQHPQAEGSLQASLGGADVRVATLDATPGDPVTLAGGQLSGVTEGSTYALFGSTSDALRQGAQPLATGRVAAVEASRATLALDAAPQHPLPARLVARETAHAFGQRVLWVRDRARSIAGRALVDHAVATLPFARLGEPAQLSIGSTSADDAEVDLYADDGSRIGGLGNPRDPGFVATLLNALQKVARVQALLGLRTDPKTADVQFCIATGQYDVYSCPGGGASGAVLKLDRPAQITAVNKSDQKRFVYVFGIDANYSVTLLLPPDGGVDVALGAHQPLQRGDIAPNSAGQYRFVTIATDAPINAAALEQDGAGTRDLAGCVTALERALCSAATGARDVSAPRVGAWTATVSTAVVQ